MVHIPYPHLRSKPAKRVGVARISAAWKEGYSDMAQSTLRLVEGNGMDKGKALDAALAQIERSFGKGSIMKLGKAMPWRSRRFRRARLASTSPLVLAVCRAAG
jgi:hypothetical protein